MKNLFLAIATLIFALTFARAQDNPYLTTGRSFVGGGLSLGIDSQVPDDRDPTLQQDNRQFFASVSPTYGRFFNDRWVMGISLTLSHRTNQQRTTGENTFRENLTREVGFGITPFSATLPPNHRTLRRVRATRGFVYLPERYF